MFNQHLMEILYAAFASFLAPLFFCLLQCISNPFGWGLIKVAVLSQLQIECAIEQPIPANMLLKSLCIFFFNILLASLSASLFVPDLKLSDMFVLLLVMPALLVLTVFFCSLDH